MVDVENAQVVKELVALGQTAGDIAANLAACGVRGRQWKSDCCPVANFLKLKFPLHRFRVTTRSIWIGDLGVVPTSQPISMFLAFFDNGYCPNLIETEEAKHGNDDLRNGG